MNSDGASLSRKRSAPFDDNEQDQLIDIQPSPHRLRVKKTVKRQKHSAVQLNEPQRSARVLARKFQDMETTDCVQSATSRLKKPKLGIPKLMKKVNDANEFGTIWLPKRVVSSKFTDIPESGSGDPNQ